MSEPVDTRAAAGSHVGFLSKLHGIYRGTIFNAVLLGLISFTQPGIWTAMNNLGAGGQASPYVVNAVNVITFAIMVIFSPLATIVGNLIGMHWIIVFGTIGYIPYSAALYCNSMWGTQWFLVFGAITCGFSAAALWPGEAAIAVGYPEIARRGLCISIWLALGKLGSIIGGAIQLSLNTNDSTQGAIAPKTYLILVAVQCLGLPLALLLAPAHKVIRADGRRPAFANANRGFKAQVRAFLSQFKRKEVILLIPAFVGAQWGVTYQGNFMVAYMTVRARTLVSLVVALVGVGVNIVMGWYLDNKRSSRSAQARWTWAILCVLFTVVWIWQLVVQVRFSREAPDVIDWSGSLWSQIVALILIYRICYEAVGVWLYWALGAFDAEADTIALSMGVLRAGESLGSAFAYTVGAVPSASLMTNLIVSVVMFYVAVPATTWASFLVPDRLPGEQNTVEASDSSVVPTEEKIHLKA